MNNIIREAKEADIPSLLLFEQALINAERPFDDSLNDEATYYNLPQMIQSTDVHLLVAEENGELTGSGYARIEEAKWYFKHKKQAYLGFMYVVPTHRGKGINKQIVEALQTWVISQGVYDVRLDVYAGNEAAIKAYEKAGFTSRMIEMRKRIE